MSLIVRNIPKELSYDEVFDYFSKYGRINDFRIKFDYAFLKYDSYSAEREVLNNHHELKGYRFHIEPEREPRNCSHCPVHCGGSRNVFESNRERSFGNMQAHPNDVNKIVLENIPQCEALELKDFVRELNLDPVYTRITSSGKHGIVEFRSIDAKNFALKELDGVVFKNSKMGARPYFNRERRDYDGRSRRDYQPEGKNGRENFDEPMGERTERCDDLRDWNNTMTENNAQ